MGTREALAVAALICVGQVFSPAVGFAQSYGLGHPPTPDEMKAIHLDVLPDGHNLPPGRGTAADGKAIYDSRCSVCHGPTGKEGPQDVLVGGRGTLAARKPLKTIGSYWPYATTLWDYINRAMPFDHPTTLTVDQVYATTAYLLYLNGIVGEHDVIDQTTLPKIQMPNRDGFVADPRPDVGGKTVPAIKKTRAETSSAPSGPTRRHGGR